MENSLTHIEIVSSSFTNIYAASGLPVGTRISIQNVGPSLIQVYIGTSPDSGKGEIVKPFEFYIVAAGVPGCFVKTNNGQTTTVAIQPKPYNLLGLPVDERVYTGYKAITIQSFTEANSKNGTEFEFSCESATVAAGASLDIVFTTDGIPVLIKNRQVSFSGAEIRAALYKGTTYTGGTTVPIFNLNTDLLLPTYSVAKLSPTITSLGTLVSATPVFYGATNQGNRYVGTFSTTGAERVLSKNTTYLYRVTNQDIGVCKISIYTSFYEGELSSQN